MKIDFTQTKLYTVFLTLFYVLGLISVFYGFDKIGAIIAFTILCALLFVSNLSFKRILVLYLLFFIGIIRANLSYNQNKINISNYNEAKITGKIITNADIKNSKAKFYVLTNSIDTYKPQNIKTKLLVSLDTNGKIENEIKLGDYISLKGKLRTPINATNPYQFDYKNYLINNDCYLILYGENNTCQKIGTVKYKGFSEDSWYYILRKFDNLREKIILEHSKNIKSPRLEILAGLVFGDETINPDENIKENFKASGLLHLLAASGLNVALIYGIWCWIAGFFRLPFNVSVLTGCFFIIFYTFMTGFPPSILRASLMILFVLFGKLIDRKSDSVALVFFVGFLILLFSPKMLFDIGFQLSFAVTFGLITCCEAIISKFSEYDKKFKEKFEKAPRFQKYFIYLFSPNAIISAITIPLVAQLWVIPLQMHYFNNFAPFSVFANIVVVIFIGILSFIGFLSSIFALIPYINTYVVKMFDCIANPLLALLIKISEIFSSFKYSLINTISLNVFQIFNFWILILIFISALKNNFKTRKHIILFTVVLTIFLASFININSNSLEIIMFDVGNADSFLIKTPNNKYIMIDTGRMIYKGYSSGQTIINRYFNNKRIRNLEIMILTHYDADHIGGSIDILKNTKCNQIIIQNSNKNSMLAKEIRKYLKDNKLQNKFAKNNEIIYEEPNLTITTLVYDNDSSNESSTICLLKYKDDNILFMADAGIEAFNHIKDFIPQNINTIKIGHHGAYGVIDENMIKYLNPKYALISTGINKYNHPDYRTIQLLNDKNIKILSSKNFGFTKMVFDKNIKLQHFDKNTKKIKDIIFENKKSIPFDKSQYIEDLIKKNL